MLLNLNGKDTTDIIKAPIQPHAKKANAPELLCQTLPNGSDGRSLPTHRELLEMLDNPKFRKAIDIIEKDMGCETMLKYTKRKEMVHDRIADMGVNIQAKAIDLANKKKHDIQTGNFK